MENRFKLRIFRMFRSSFGSCRTRNVSDVIEKAVLSRKNHNNFHLIEPSSSPPLPKARPLPSLCKPRCPESTQGAINLDCIMVAPRESLPRRKLSACHPPFLVSAADFDGRKCPPASPISHLNLFSDCKDFGFYEKKKSLAREKKMRKKKNNKRVHVKSKNMSSTTTTFFSSPSHEIATYNNHGGRGWWSTSEDESETLFSSKTLSSESSDSFRRQHSNHRRRYNTRRQRRAKSGSCNMGVLPLEGSNKVKDSFAVVKSSNDPYNDFRASMVEMIIERQIVAAKDLEQLLQCFLSLNSHHHHRIIVEVFTEIWEALFSNWS